MIDEQTLKEINTCPPAKNIAEEIYILKRRIKAFGNSLCFYLCRLFPIKKNLVSVCTFEGKCGFGCNPKYIVQELHKMNPEIDFVWFVNKNVFDEKDFPEYIKKVPNTLWSRAYWLTRSKVWIDNYRKPYGTVKRSGQYYLNVNHYTIGIKCTGLWRGEGFSKMAYLVSKNDSDMIDDLVIDSEWCEEVSPNGLVYSGRYLKTGAPRCDVLYGNRDAYRDNIKDRYGIPRDANVVMYAPTFREGAKDGKRSVYESNYTLDYKRLITKLHEKFGGEWYICLRVHPQLASAHKAYEDKLLENRIIDVSKEDNMYEILAGMDAYITDYSSAVFEAGFAHIPSFIYADDIQKYANDRGSLMWNIASDPLGNIGNNKVMTPSFDLSFPFSVATNNDELEENIMEFDQGQYDDVLNHFHDTVKLVFNGKASENIARGILKHLAE